METLRGYVNSATFGRRIGGGWRYFKSLVDDGAEWDYKPLFNRRDISFVTLAGHELRMDVVANILYGFVGKAAGFTNLELLGGAGVAQQRGGAAVSTPTIFGDELVDAQAIRLGMWLYDTYGDDLTLEDFNWWINYYVEEGYFDDYVWPEE